MLQSKSQAIMDSQRYIADSYNSMLRHKVGGQYLNLLKDSDRQSQDFTVAMMRNFAKIMDSDKGQAITMSSDFGPMVPEIWPLVVAFYENFPLKDLVSMQPMEQPRVLMPFSQLLTGTKKGETSVGDMVEVADRMRKIDGRYPTGEIFNEEITGEEVSFNAESGASEFMLAYNPLRTQAMTGDIEKIRLVVTNNSDEDTVYVADTLSGNTLTLKLTDGTSVAGATLDVNLGLVVLPEASGATATSVKTIKACYVWNNETATQKNIQRVKEHVEEVWMQAQPRALEFDWTIFAEMVKKTQFGRDMRTDNLPRIMSLMHQYMVRYILDEMYIYAQGNSGAAIDVTLPTSSVYSLDVKVNRLLEQLNVVGNDIEITSGRMAGNKLVVGRAFKSFLESLPEIWYKPTEKGNTFSTPRKIGQIAQYDVFFDPMRGANEAFMTYRGSEYYDAAYYVGEYLPVAPTDAINLGIDVKQAFVSMEAYKFHKPTCVYKLNLVNE